MATETLTHTAAGFADHLPVLVVLVPFVTAPLLVLLGSRRLAFPLSMAATLLAFVFSIEILASVLESGVISYHLGGWAPPLGIEYRIDAANAFVLLLVTAIATVVLPFARVSIRAEIASRHETLFYALFMLCLTGLLGVVATGDAFNVFVFLEISSLSTYVLVAMGAERDRRALTASYNYLIMGTIGATFFVIGIGLLYMATGTLNMADIAARVAEQGDSRTVRAAFAFVVVGIGLKLAIYPLHLWLPNAYGYSPSAVSAFVAATATKVAVYVLLRFMFSVFQPGFAFSVNTLTYLIVPFALLAMFAASFIAVFQNDFKRMLAYSSIAQIGYMLLGIGMLSETGLAATLVHLFNHAVTKVALFMGAGAFVYAGGSTFYSRLQGLGRVMPWTSAAIVISGLSLIGVPGTAGFISKWVLVQAALERGWWPIALAVVLSSLLAVIYVWRVIESLYLKQPAEGETRGEVPLLMLLPIWVAALACVYFGLDTQVTLGAATEAARSLMAGAAGLY